jgi:hypothetical protein
VKRSICAIGIAMAALTTIALAPAAHAAATSFSNRIDFNAAIDASPQLIKSVEGFDTVPPGTIIPDGSTFDGVLYSSSAGDLMITDGFLALSPSNTLGTIDPEFQSFLPGDTLMITFPHPIVAFGISVNTFATETDAYEIVTDQGDVAPSSFDPFPGADTGEFVGLISDTPFISATLASDPSVRDAFTLDDLTSATVVPEPASLALLSGGLLPLVGRRRRQK